MIQTKSSEIALMEASFYENPFSFSYSSLSTLLTAPLAFYAEYILKQKESDFKKYLLEGTIIHYLVLEHRGFSDRFMVLGDNLPSENNAIIAERIFTEHYPLINNPLLGLKDFPQEIDEILTEINLHQSVKDLDKRLAKIIEPKTEAYFDFLKTKGDKTIIDSALLDKCTKRADIVKADPSMRALLGMDIVSDGRNYGVYNELPIEISSEELGLPFGLKGIIDNTVVDTKNKLVRINDFKTTGKSLVDFKEAVEYWNLWLQAAMYIIFIRKYLNKVLTAEWTIEFRFLVFDKYDQLYPFLVTPGTMAEWLESFEVVKKEALYHYESRDYSLPYDFAHGNVEL